MATFNRTDTVGAAAAGNPAVDISGFSLIELADHIEQTHHAYLRTELPRICDLAEKAAGRHSEVDAHLLEVRNVVRQLAVEMLNHMVKEERILFPMVRELDKGNGRPFAGWTLAHPIRVMESEHADADAALERLRALTDGYTVPPKACATHRALLHALARLERDLHTHVHKENNILFPRALERERSFQEPE